MSRRTFSVVIATYRRPALLRGAVASVLAQKYPHDHFELIVVDNAGDAETERIVRQAADAAPIPVTYLVEPRNGCSAARNRGAAAARFDVVAFLDDDAVAHPTWLAAFDRAIREQHAMVVGGRTAPVIADGASPPVWFRSPFIQTHFGANRSRTDPEIERLVAGKSIAVGGGNSAYDRRLFLRFGGFPTAHGRTASRLRASEETSLNLILERHGIPISLASAARIDHLVPRDRLTKAHLRRRSFWRGISIGEIRVQVAGRRSLPGQLVATVRALPGMTIRWLRAPNEAERFPRECQLRDQIGVLIGLIGGAIRANPLAVTVEWSTRDWLDEAQRWPEGVEKQRRLYELHRELGDERAAQAALDRLIAALPDGAPEPPAS